LGVQPIWYKNKYKILLHYILLQKH
jgi:hypothetical protein